MATYNLDRKSYSGNTPTAAQLDLYTFEYPWDTALYSTFVSKTKITFADASTYTKRIEAEHYAVFSLTDVNPVGVSFSINPTGSSEVIGVNEVRQEYDLLATPTDYYPHLQFPDDANIYNYFQLWITGTENPVDANLSRIRYSIFSPNMSGKIIVETELRYGI